MGADSIKCRIIEEELGTFWPQWHVVKRLGGGAYGDVFEIYRDHFDIREESALKVIQIGDTTEATETISNETTSIPEALRNEIQIMEVLRGAPNIVTIEDFYYKEEVSGGLLFVRMELLTSFKAILADRKKRQSGFSVKEVMKLGADICTALMYCEKRGIIHRDIKPANLFVDDFGNYKVGDFGVSKRMETVHLVQNMTGIGTISYMAPELFAMRSGLSCISCSTTENCRFFLPKGHHTQYRTLNLRTNSVLAAHRFQHWPESRKRMALWMLRLMRSFGKRARLSQKTDTRQPDNSIMHFLAGGTNGKKMLTEGSGRQLCRAVTISQRTTLVVKKGYPIQEGTRSHSRLRTVDHPDPAFRCLWP